jgi:tetratricopeptide (TPR) repeat protein
MPSSSSKLTYLFLSLLATPIFAMGVKLQAQQKPMSAGTKGPCSPIVYGNRNVIECGELSQHDAAMLASILNEARSSNRSLAEIKEMLQKALEGQDPNKTSVTYQPDGEEVASNNSGGISMSISLGEELIFQQFVSLEKQQKWSDIIQLAEKEKLKVPTWYSVYAYEGNAYAATCNYPKAIEDLSFFISKTENIGNYQQMVSIVKANLSTVQNHLNDPVGQVCSSHFN